MRWWERVGRFAERTLIDGVLAITGTVATYLAVRYTYGWHQWSGDPPVEAIGFSLVIVLFSIMMFEFAVDGVHRKSRWAWLMFVAWAITALYSMQATMAGQYIGIQKKALERLELVQEDRTAAVELESVQGQAEMVKAEREPYEKRQADLLKILGEIDTVEERYEWKRTVEITEKQLEEVNAKLESYAEELRGLEARAAELAVTVKVEELKGSSGDVFAFYSQVLGIEDVEKVEFWMTVYRSVALDTVNVLCFMLVMVRRRKRHDDDGDVQADTKRPIEGIVRSTGGDRVLGQDGGVSEADGPDEAVREGMEDGAGAGPEEEEKKEPRPIDALQVLGDDTYNPGRRNGTFTSWARARRMGISRGDYEKVVQRGCERGVLVKRKGVLYRNEYFGKEDFIREVLTDGW